MLKSSEREKILKTEQFFADYLKDFTGSGIDMKMLPEGSSVTLYLGTIESYEPTEL